VTQRAAAAVLVAVVLSGCGASKPHAPPGCLVRVFFASRMVTGRAATQDEIRAVRARIASSSKVRSYAFVSTRNRQPESFQIVPRSGDDARALASELGSERGVEHVGIGRAC